MVLISPQQNEIMNTIAYVHYGDARLKAQKHRKVAEPAPYRLKVMALQTPHSKAFMYIHRNFGVKTQQNDMWKTHDYPD